MLNDLETMDVLFEQYDGVRDDAAKRRQLLAKHQSEFDRAREVLATIYPDEAPESLTDRALLRTLCHPDVLKELEITKGLERGSLSHAPEMIERDMLLLDGALTWDSGPGVGAGIWDKTLVSRAQELTDTSTKKRRAVELFLFQMENGGNPGITRFGRTMHKKEGWLISRYRELYLATDGEWWIGGLEPTSLGQIPSSLDEWEINDLLTKALAAHGLKALDN